MTAPVFASVLVGVGIALLFTRLLFIEQRLRQLSRLEGKVDILLRNAGLTDNDLTHLPSDVREAIDRGERVLATQRYRQATGAGLKEARDIVDEVRRRRITAS